ncbi:MAG: HNH endonuclease [Candidatus Falkowbacteria bacterium]
MENFLIETIEKVDKIEDQERRKRIINIIKLVEGGVIYEDISKIYNISRQRISQLVNQFADEYRIIREINSINICDICKKKGKNTYIRSDGRHWCDKCIKKERRKKKKRWSRDYDKCVDCGTTEKKHVSRGRCVDCSRKFLYHYNLKRKKSIKKAGEKWRKANPDKIRAINKKAAKKLLEKVYGGNRERALIRDGYKCFNCRVSKDETTLCTTRLDQAGDYVLDNLVTLCRKCHFGFVRGLLKLKYNIKKSDKIQ